MALDLKERIQRIQRHLGLAADGIIGVATVTALEQALLPASITNALSTQALTVSRRGLDALVHYEISSPAYYRKFLSTPAHPGGASGCTIGIGYDLGYNSSKQIRKDWQACLSERDMDQLAVAAGLKGDSAKEALPDLKHIHIPLKAAQQVFYQVTLPRYAKLTRKAYPGVEALYPDAQSALLSLVYNRGGSLSGSRRREMKAIVPLVALQDYQGIAEQILAMCRLWQDTGLDGLLRRREAEAKLVTGSPRNYSDDELLVL